MKSRAKLWLTAEILGMLQIAPTQQHSGKASI